MKLKSFSLAFAFMAIGGATVFSGESRANEISYYSTIYSTDWVTSGVGGMRGTGLTSNKDRG